MGIQFENVSYRYVSSAFGLEGLGVSLAPGRFTAVLGGTGSGKSTLLQLINGLLRPTEGKLRVLDFELEAGKVFKQTMALRRRVGLVFQFPESQLFEDSVEKDLCYGALNFGASTDAAKASAEQALRLLGLDRELLDRHPLQLSGGQMRKVAIASVLVTDPDVLLLDEPAASLDQASRDELMQLLHRLCREQGKTLVVVTHRLEEVLPYADDFLVVHRGKALFHGNGEELLGREDVLLAAGIAVPPVVTFVRSLCDTFGLDRWDGSYRPAEIAAKVKAMLTAT